MLTGLGGLAEFERELIRARTGEGRDRAKAKDVRMGRKPKLTDHQKREAIKRRDHGEETIVEIGRSYNIISLAGESAGVRFFDLAAVPL
jgi:DNA invertase Pin-like site-specific DNA recombinase